jgi:hypothetical protein
MMKANMVLYMEVSRLKAGDLLSSQVKVTSKTLTGSSNESGVGSSEVRVGTVV